MVAALHLSAETGHPATMTPDIGKPIVLKGQRAVLARNLILPPLGFALLWLLVDYLHYGRIPVATWSAAGAMLALAAVGVTVAVLPDRLAIDDDGISWSHWGKTRFFHWAEITDLGVAHLRGTEGWNTPVVRSLTGGFSQRSCNPPMIGLNVTPAQSKFKDEATRAYRAGFTGYEVNIPNSFGQPVEDITQELRVRWQRRRLSPNSP
jgi:hypothetical protein